MPDSIVKVIPATEVLSIAGIESTLLLTRPLGKKFLDALASLLNAGTQPTSFILDFAGIQIMDGSFADEALVAIAVIRSQKSRALPPLALSHLSPSSKDDLLFALMSRPRRERQLALRNCVLPLIEAHDSVVLLGEPERHVSETFSALIRNETLTARSLADELRLEIAAASTRLKVVFDLGLALRDEQRTPQGKEFSYYLPW